MTESMPVGVAIDSASGRVTPSTGHYSKRLADLEGLFADRDAWAETARLSGNPIVYEVIEHRSAGNDLVFGTTIMQPGKVGTEFFMTRGHFHQRRDMGEIYYTQSGHGLLLLESRAGQSETVALVPGTCTVIPPDWAHRSINTGTGPLVFVWVCNPLAGNDYGDILKRGMRKLVVERGGEPVVIPNPRFTGI